MEKVTPWRHRLLPILWGGLGATVASLLIASVFACWIVWNRARNGQAAAECLSNPTCLNNALQNMQRAAQAPPAK